MGNGNMYGQQTQYGGQQQQYGQQQQTQYGGGYSNGGFHKGNNAYGQQQQQQQPQGNSYGGSRAPPASNAASNPFGWAALIIPIFLTKLEDVNIRLLIDDSIHLAHFHSYGEIYNLLNLTAQLTKAPR